MEQLVAGTQQRQISSTRSLSSRELSNSISSTATSGDEETSSKQKQNFQAIVEKWKQRAQSNTDLNHLINSMNNTSLNTIKMNKTKFNKDTWKSSVCFLLFTLLLFYF